MFPHPGPVNSHRRDFPASDVCELRTNWEYQLLFRISSRGPPSSKCLCAEPPRFLSEASPCEARCESDRYYVLTPPGFRGAQLASRPLVSPSRSRNFLFWFNSKVLAESKLFHHSFD